MENRGTYEKGEGEKRAGLASLNQPNTKKGSLGKFFEASSSLSAFPIPMLERACPSSYRADSRKGTTFSFLGQFRGKLFFSFATSKFASPRQGP